MAFLSSSGVGSPELDATSTPPPQFTISSNSASNPSLETSPPSDSLLKPENHKSNTESAETHEPATPTRARSSDQRSPNLTPTHSRKNSTIVGNRPGSYRTVSAVSTPTTSRSTAVRSPGTVTPIHQAGLGRPQGGSFGMATHEALNPHTAADLLRQAMMQSRNDDDNHDQIGSNGSTPPGAATPRPDPSDKRLPGILHGYFGQVGETFTKASLVPTPTAPASSDPIVTTSRSNTEHRGLGVMAGIELPTAPGSPSELLGVGESLPELLPHELFSRKRRSSRSGNKNPHAYPTPPDSSSPSPHKHLAESCCDDSVAVVVEKQRVNRRTLSRQHNTAHAMAPKARRNTYAVSNPLSSIITTSTIHAPHLSNPASCHLPENPYPSISSRHDRSHSTFASSSYHELKGLTRGVAAPLSKKNTPPHTPRALSNDSGHPEKQGLTSMSNSTFPGVPAASSGGGGKQNMANDGGSNPANGPGAGNHAAAVGPPRGKLSVTICEARGLRPSRHPYVVCVFEFNEYISRGPRMEEIDIDQSNGSKKDTAGGGVSIRRSGSDMGKPMAIPMKSRQSSNTSIPDAKEFKNVKQMTAPKWGDEAIFDVVNLHSEIDIYVYDRSNEDAFLGHVRSCPNLDEQDPSREGWYKLESRSNDEHVSGEVRLQMRFQKTDKKHYGPDDFTILKLIGKGTFGQVYQVRKKDTQRIYAMKVLSKKVIVQKKEVAHTLGERNILVRTAMADSPFIVGLKFSFQTPTDLYLVTDYMSGGELFWHLQREGRFLEARAKFYIAELILALEHLHGYDIVYRDLKPENILLDANGHVALCDFGLSKANLTKNDTTNTFCGTTEYLAPEVLLDDHGYTKMVDFWSLGVLVFEMCCGWSPFYADDTQQMYKNIAFGKVRFPKEIMSNEGRNFVKGLLNRNAKHRLGAINDAEELKAHPFFANIDWVALKKKDVVPPFKPKLKSVLDTSNFDPEFTNVLTSSSSLNARAAALASAVPASTPLSPGMQAKFKGFTFVDESSIEEHFANRDVEAMDEDEKEEDDSWEKLSITGEGNENRMSGILKTDTSGDDADFPHGNFDME
ncbi:MAG: hypothetical protein M1836_007209 [Candelina mexicana]|nr:MAG: hypothetical protein M1836_007209 [Candelina mexicana]